MTIELFDKIGAIMLNIIKSNNRRESVIKLIVFIVMMAIMIASGVKTEDALKTMKPSTPDWIE